MRSRQRRDRQEKVTLQDIAKAAGVSAITVSRALREPQKVSETLRDDILRRVSEMGYVPDLAARALASRHNGIICVLTPVLGSYNFLSVMRGIEQRAQNTDFRIQYATSLNDVGEELYQLNLLVSQNPSGIIVVGIEDNDNIAHALRRARCPVVQIRGIGPHPVDMSIGIDHHAAAAAAARHLLDAGYRRIGLIGGWMDARAKSRLAGYRQVMEEAGLYDPALTVSEDVPSSVHLGCKLLLRLLEKAPDTDAVFCQNDDVALGVIFECQRRGISIPDDFGVCGFNDLDFAAVTEPPLTTIRVPRFEIGYRATDMVIRRASGEEIASQVVDLDFKLITRQSTRRIGDAARSAAGATQTPYSPKFFQK